MPLLWRVAAWQMLGLPDERVQLPRSRLGRGAGLDDSARSGLRSRRTGAQVARARSLYGPDETPAFMRMFQQPRGYVRSSRQRGMEGEIDQVVGSEEAEEHGIRPRRVPDEHFL